MIVIQEPFEGSLEAYKEAVELTAKNNMEDYQKVSESEVTIDGRQGLFIIWRGTTPDKIPVKYLASIVPFDGGMTRIAAFTLEPLFDEAQKTFEKVMLSYETIRK